MRQKLTINKGLFITEERNFMNVVIQAYSVSNIYSNVQCCHDPCSCHQLFINIEKISILQTLYMDEYKCKNINLHLSI